MARSPKSVSSSPKQPLKKKPRAAPPRSRKSGGSGASFKVMPVVFILSVIALLFGANCRQRSEIGTPDRPIGAVVRPNNAPPPGPAGARVNRPGFTRPGTNRPGPGAPPPGAPRTAAEEQMLLGNPDNATGDAGNREHFLIQRSQYALSYNDNWHFPNWVAWHLTAKDIGDADRGSFVPDPDLPGDFTRVVTSDYNRSGYDRGHNCPSKDRTATREDNDIVFYMSNITPQRHELNAGPWERLETYCRQLAQEGNELYIICGHSFKNASIRRMGPKQIAIPDFGWKIVVVLPEQGGDDRARINRTSRVIAVQMPNVKGISKQGWEKYIVTVNDIERSTGLHFFDALPADVASALKSKQDSGSGQ